MFRSLQLILIVALLSVVALPSVAQNTAFLVGGNSNAPFLVGGNFDEAFRIAFKLFPFDDDCVRVHPGEPCSVRFDVVFREAEGGDEMMEPVVLGAGDVVEIEISGATLGYVETSEPFLAEIMIVGFSRIGPCRVGTTARLVAAETGETAAYHGRWELFFDGSAIEAN